MLLKIEVVGGPCMNLKYPQFTLCETVHLHLDLYTDVTRFLKNVTSYNMLYVGIEVKPLP